MAQGVMRVHGARHHAVGAEALLRLRDRCEPVLPVRGAAARRRSSPSRATADVVFDADSALSAHAADQRADDDPQDGVAPRRGAQDLSACASARSAGEALPVGADDDGGHVRRRPARRARHGRDVAHLHLQSPRRRAPRHAGAGGARFRGEGVRRAGRRAAPRREWDGCGCAAGRAPSATGSTWRRPSRAFRGEWYVSGRSHRHGRRTVS